MSSTHGRLPSAPVIHDSLSESGLQMVAESSGGIRTRRPEPQISGALHHHLEKSDEPASSSDTGRTGDAALDPCQLRALRPPAMMLPTV